MLVMKGPNQRRSFIVSEARKETMAAEIKINGYKAHVLLDPYTQRGDLISTNFNTLVKLPLPSAKKILRYNSPPGVTIIFYLTHIVCVAKLIPACCV